MTPHILVSELTFNLATSQPRLGNPKFVTHKNQSKKIGNLFFIGARLIRLKLGSSLCYPTVSKTKRSSLILAIFLFQVNKDDLKGTQQAIEKVHNICQGGKSAMELIAEINTLYSCIR